MLSAWHASQGAPVKPHSPSTSSVHVKLRPCLFLVSMLHTKQVRLRVWSCSCCWLTAIAATSWRWLWWY